MTKSVLIIDDDQTLVAPLREGLESLGYRVAAAFDGREGLLKAHDLRPDAIILDFNMPGEGGGGVYEKLRKAPSTESTPVIFSTAVSQEEVKGRISPGRSTFFLKKPVGLNQIISILNSVLGTPSAPAPEGAITAPSARRNKYHEFDVRVTYADTDKMGIIYYANYFRYFEEGRTELMRSLGLRYRDLEVQRKLFIPCVETGCKYLAPSRYDDLLTVRTWISSLGRASIAFENEIYDKDLGGQKVATGFSRHALVNDLWRTAKIPDDIRRLLEPYAAAAKQLLSRTRDQAKGF